MSPTTLALVMPARHRDHLGVELAERLSEFDIVADDDPQRRAKAEFAIALLPPPGELAAMPALRCVIAPSAGIDHVLADPSYPRQTPLVRMTQGDLGPRMVEYVVLHVLRHHRRAPDFDAQQRAGVWDMLWPQKAAHERTVGLMGLGDMGAPVARALIALGFKVRGWARSPRPLEGVETFAGPDEFGAFLAGTEILVNLLPATPQTRRLVDAGVLARLPRGAAVINAGRGATLVEDDLLAALDSGWIDSATLDVFEVEPLPAGHPFWAHPRVTITPHNASSLTAAEMADGARAVVAAVQAGREPPQRVDLDRGY